MRSPSLRRSVAFAVAALSAAAPLRAQGGGPTIASRYHGVADSLIDAAMRDSAAYQRLGILVDRFGNRLSGSANLERAIDWILAEMTRDGLEHVHGERAMVPHWVRGAESATLIEPRRTALHMLGLGGSVGTPVAGITAPVLVVRSLDELTKRAAEARGKLVLFDVPWDTAVPPFQEYGTVVPYRYVSTAAAARVGAVGVLLRSVASFSIQSPHTGGTGYDSTLKRLPIAALSVEDAAMLHRMSDRGDRVVVHLAMEARTLPDAPSRNVVAEITGREHPDEVVVLGGHIDSWDVGQGAMDDGGGAVAAWEAVRLMQRLGLHPRRTVRVVLWTNEENGGRGGLAYRDAHRDALAHHVLAMESDNGVFAPRGFHFTGSDSALRTLTDVGHLLDRIGAGAVDRGDPEADVTPLSELGVPAVGLDVDASRYFWFHHTQADMLTVLDPRDVARCVATMAVMAYVVADLPDPLPHAPPAKR